MKRITSFPVFLFLAFHSTLLFAQSGALTVTSPDKKLTVQFLLDGNAPFYTVQQGKTLVLQKSQLGLLREDGDFSQDLSLLSASKSQLVTDKYEILNAKRKNNTYRANRRVFHLQNGAGEKMDVIFQVSNDGVAFQYFFPGQSDDVKKIREEKTSFRFDPASKAWLQPMSVAKTGWESTNPSYEEYYHKNVAVGTPSPTNAGWVYPALFQTGNTWVLITESAPEGDYCGTRLQQQSAGGEYRVGFPQEQERNPNGALNPESRLPWTTPWRIVAIGSLKTIVESTLGTDLAKPAIKMDPSFIKPGQSAWSWVLLKDDSTVVDVQRRFINYASDMQWPYLLVDADWDRKIGYEKIKELADYAKTKNVRLLLWYNSAGPWNTAPYTPRDKMLTSDVRRNEFKRIQDMGIAGIKVDFFGGDGQSVMQYYTDILKDAADHQLLVNFHGCTLPRGWQRTYPNLMTMESIKGMEFITFEQANADEAPSHAAMVPFTRNAFDPMDYTPMALHEIPRIKRRTTSAHELALPVLFQSGIQHLAEIPRGMALQPDYVKNFLRQLPDVWEDTRFVAGFPGELAVIARQANGRWFVAGINGQNQEKQLDLDLAFLKGKTGKLITDSQEAGSFQQADVKVGTNGKAKVTLKPNGGFVMVF